MSQKEISPPELRTVEIEQPATKATRSQGLTKIFNTVSEWDLFVAFDIFYLTMTWLFLVCQKDKHNVFAANSFAWWVSLVFLVDLMFRLLSARIACMQPHQWNHLWLCLFPILFSMLAALYDYERAIYGNKPLQVWNALFYTCYLVGAVGCAVYHKLN